jgi:hypothetical protein
MIGTFPELPLAAETVKDEPAASDRAGQLATDRIDGLDAS